jgi:hypothetical protein
VNNAATISALKTSLSHTTEPALRERLQRAIEVLRTKHTRAERHSPVCGYAPTTTPRPQSKVHLAAAVRAGDSKPLLQTATRPAFVRGF